MHHRRDFDPTAGRRRGWEVTPLAQTLVDSWRLLTVPDRTGLVIQAVGDRLLLPWHLVEALPAPPKAPRELRRLAGLLTEGCRSPLELWGALHVFRRIPGLRRQVRIAVGTRNYYLDGYAEAERVDFELDGAEWHSAPGQRERDIRRDARLATLGILRGAVQLSAADGRAFSGTR